MKNPQMVEIPEEMYKELLEIEQKYLFTMKKFEEVLKNSEDCAETDEKLVNLLEHLYKCYNKNLTKVLGRSKLQKD